MKDRVCVHGAAGSIGSSCVEVISSKHHLILDYGKPLEGEGSVPFEFPSSKKKRENYIVIISHSHPDHAGFINSVPEDVPIYMTELTKKALLLNDKKNIQRGVTVVNEKVAIKLNSNLSFIMLPMSHSAPDGCGVFIQTNGNNILYSGDFRTHGYEADNCLKEIKTVIDNDKPLILISEATNVGATEKEQIEEFQLVEKFAENFKKPGLVVVKLSNQNVERVATVLEACKKTDRILVTEPYTALCAKELSVRSLNPQIANLKPDGESWRVFNYPTKKTLEIRDDNKLFQFKGKYKITKEEIAQKKERIVIIANTQTERYLEKQNLIDRVVWSMWTGYEGYKKLCEKHQVEVIHSSGHVYVDDWINVIKELAPFKTILVHTEHPKEAAELINEITVPVVAERNKTIKL